MATPQDTDARLCEGCSKIDFSSLFSEPIRSFQLGTLSAIRQHESCPFCCLAVCAIDNKSPELGDAWTMIDPAHVKVHVKTTYWACHARQVNARQVISRRSVPARRYRPALGIEWTLDDEAYRKGPIYLSICELDSITSEHNGLFPDYIQQDQTQILRRRPVLPKIDLALVQGWIRECESNHNHLVDRVDVQSQLRATGQFQVYDVIKSRLVRPATHVGYFAISYVWGDALRRRQLLNPSSWWADLFEDSEPVSRSQSTTEGRGVRFSRLPKTIQDASLLLRHLGLRYLWVDLLCVCQDKSEQKQLLIDRMHMIYQGASVTLVAAGGSDADSPLHGLCSDLRALERKWTIPTQKGDLDLMIARPDLRDLLASTQWITRGWTFQEDVLSCCCLYFTKDEIFYSCRYHTHPSTWSGLTFKQSYPSLRFSEWRESYVLETRAIETSYQSLSPWNEAWWRPDHYGLRFTSDENKGKEIASKHSKTTADRHPWDFSGYAHLVREYSKKTLTKQGDIVNAFLGILNQFNAGKSFSTHAKYHGLLEDRSAKSELDDSGHDAESASKPGPLQPAHALYYFSLAKSLLWIPARASALRRRYMEPSPGVDEPQQYPSWSWSGWLGEIEYAFEKRGGFYCQDLFSPVKFMPKRESSDVVDVLQWSTRGDKRVVAWLTHAADMRGATSPRGATDRNVCALTLLTLTAETTLKPRFGYMSQHDQTWSDHFFFEMPTPNEAITGFFPDAGARIWLRSCKLVCVGHLGRSTFDDPETELIVLALERKGDCYERRGMNTVRRGDFDWTLEWVDIV